nr:putative OPA3-like protein CG13603 [Onthophagus taurus]XP_022909469.1 putative OPA3-like protein CG13603 [Onthophagus taurus]
MVVGAFPAAKLGALLLKQISKPIANAAKAQAKNSPFFRKYICMPPAQFYNWCEVKAKMWILNLGKPVNIPVLNEAMAIELGANLLGEGIIFIIAAGLLINEYARSSRKEYAKEVKKKQEMELVQQTLQELFFTIETQGTQIRELTRTIHDLESRTVHKPWAAKKDKPKDDVPPPPPSGNLAPIITLQEVEIFDCEPNEKVSHMETPAFSLKSLQKSVSEASGTLAPIITIEEVDVGERKHDAPENIIPEVMRNKKSEISTNLLLKAVDEINEEFFSNEKSVREDGIVTKAINFFYSDVYRVKFNA